MSRKTWQTIFRIFIALLALGILSLHVGKVDEIIDAFSSINILFVAFAIILMIVNIYIQYKKWLYILHLYYPDVSKKQALGSILVGFTLGLMTPGRLGELGRGLFLQNLNKLHVTGLTFIDKMFNNLAIFFAGCLAFYYMLKYPYNLSIYVLVPYSVIVFVVWVLLFQLLTHPEKIYLFFKTRFEKSSRLSKVKDFFESLEKLHKKQVGIIFSYSVLFYFVIFLQLLLLVEAFTDYSILPTFAAIVAAMFSKTLLPISIGDLGIREGAAIYFLNQVGVLKLHAFNGALLLFSINILLPSILGITLIPRLSIINNNKED